VEELLFKKGLTSDLILLGTSGGHDFSGTNVIFFYITLKHFFQKKWSLNATIANLPNNAWVQNNLDFLAQ